MGPFKDVPARSGLETYAITLMNFPAATGYATKCWMGINHQKEAKMNTTTNLTASRVLYRFQKVRYQLRHTILSGQEERLRTHIGVDRTRWAGIFLAKSPAGNIAR
jgi:hypothetical protein